MPSKTFSNLAGARRATFIEWLGRGSTLTMLCAFNLVAALAFGALTPARFFSGETFRAMAFEMPEMGILALAMMVPLMSGGLNLAIIATANLAGLVIAAVVTNLIQPSSPPLAVTGVIALAIVAGSITALAIGLAT